MNEELSAAVDELRDIEAIKQLKARYFRAVDTKDVETFRQLFTEEATFEALGRVRRGRDEIVGMSSLVQPELRTVHHGFTPEIDITGPATASAIWAMEDFAILPPEDGHQVHVHGYGHYHETYEKRDGRWSIATLRLTRLRVDRSDEPVADDATSRLDTTGSQVADV